MKDDIENIIRLAYMAKERLAKDGVEFKWSFFISWDGKHERTIVGDAEQEIVFVPSGSADPEVS